jgi:HlyD family secretion protein
LRFVAVELGLADLDGNVQVRRGLKPGDRVVLYAEKVLTAHSRIHVVERLDGAAP